VDGPSLPLRAQPAHMWTAPNANEKAPPVGRARAVTGEAPSRSGIGDLTPRWMVWSTHLDDSDCHG